MVLDVGEGEVSIARRSRNNLELLYIDDLETL